MAQKKILIVEDNPEQMLALTQALVQAGFAVLQSATGQEGFVMAMSHEPDLIVADRLMPGLNGLEMMKKIREKKWGAQVPVIFLSNVPLSSEADKAEIDTLKPLEYLIKSEVEIKKVVEKISAALDPKKEEKEVRLPLSDI